AGLPAIRRVAEGTDGRQAGAYVPTVASEPAGGQRLSVSAGNWAEDSAGGTGPLEKQAPPPDRPGQAGRRGQSPCGRRRRRTPAVVAAEPPQAGEQGPPEAAEPSAA